MPRRNQDRNTAVEVFVEGTQAYRIHQLMLQGKTVNEISAELKTAEENIRAVMTREKIRMTAEMQSMQENYMAVTHARTEWLLSKVFPTLEKQAENIDAGPDKNLLKTAMEIMKFQGEVLHPKNMEKTGPDIVLTQTFVGTSAMYEEARQGMQEGFKEVRIEREKNPELVIPPDPKMVRLEELATKFLPASAFEDDDKDAEYGDE